MAINIVAFLQVLFAFALPLLWKRDGGQTTGKMNGTMKRLLLLTVENISVPPCLVSFFLSSCSCSCSGSCSSCCSCCSCCCSCKPQKPKKTKSTEKPGNQPTAKSQEAKKPKAKKPRSHGSHRSQKPKSQKAKKPRSHRSQKPRSHRSQKPRSHRSQKPRSHRSHKSQKPRSHRSHRSHKSQKPRSHRSHRSHKSQKPRSQEAKKPQKPKAKKPQKPQAKSQKAKKPRSQEATEAKSQEAKSQKPRSQEAKSQEAKKPKAKKPGIQENKKKIPKKNKKNPKLNTPPMCSYINLMRSNRSSRTICICLRLLYDLKRWHPVTPWQSLSQCWMLLFCNKACSCAEAGSGARRLATAPRTTDLGTEQLFGWHQHLKCGVGENDAHILRVKRWVKICWNQINVGKLHPWFWIDLLQCWVKNQFLEQEEEQISDPTS